MTKLKTIMLCALLYREGARTRFGGTLVKYIRPGRGVTPWRVLQNKVLKKIGVTPLDR